MKKARRLGVSPDRPGVLRDTSGVSLGIRSVAGFTLLEVLTTLAILSLFIITIFGGFRLGVGAWEKGEEIVEKSQKKTVIFDLLSQQVKSSFPYRIKAEKAEADYLAFMGESSSLRFVSAFSIKARRQEGLVFVMYRVEEGRPSGKVLKIYEKRVLNKNMMDETPKDEEFLTVTEDLSDLRFEYFDEGEGKEETGEWVESWDSKEKKALPAQVKITFTWKEKREDLQMSLPSLISLPARVYDDRGKLPPPGPRPIPPK